MTLPAYRQLRQCACAPRTAAQDSAIRLALGMMQLDPASHLSAPQRQGMRNRLERVDAEGVHVPFSPEELAVIKTLLLPYLQAQRPSIVAIVTAQFEETPTHDHL